MDEFMPLVRKARERGIETIVCDGYADGPAKALADVSRTVDVRDVDAVAAICREEGVDGIITAFSDLLAECCSAIAERAGLPFYLSPSRLELLRDKVLMKRMFSELGVPYPKTRRARRETLDEDLSGLAFPVVTKPVSAWGSHGVFLLDSADEVRARFDEVAGYADADCILVEEYCPGHELNMMTWVLGGEPHVLDIADREKSVEVAHVTPHVSRIAYPSVLTDLVIDEARDIARRVAHHVGLDCGPLCMQFFWSPERGIQVCECAGRVFGYEHEMLEYATFGQVTIEDLLLDCVYDQGAIAGRLERHDPHLARCAAGLYFHGYEGPIVSIEGVPESGELTGVIDTLRYYEPGDVISHRVGAKPYVVRIYLATPTRAELDRLTDEIFSSVRVTGPGGASVLYHSERASYADAQSQE